MKKQFIGILLMLLCAVCLCSGQFIWKMYDGLIPLVCGFALYGFGALAMLVAYRFGSLSVLQPINSISYVFSAALGAIFFGEVITVLKAAGIAVIMAGIILLARGERVKA